jgi:MFS family permease
MPETPRQGRPPAQPVAVTDDFRRRDLIRWGAVLAGLVVAIASLTLLSILGTAIGLTAEPVVAGEFDLGLATTVWGFATAALAFLAGGLVAGVASTRTPGAGIFNGMMVGVSAIAVLALAVGMGIGNLLGAGAANLAQIAELGSAFETDEALEFAQAQTDDARIAAWGAFLVLLGALILAAVGGLLGARSAAAATDDEPARR